MDNNNAVILAEPGAGKSELIASMAKNAGSETLKVEFDPQIGGSVRRVADVLMEQGERVVYETLGEKEGLEINFMPKTDDEAELAVNIEMLFSAMRAIRGDADPKKNVVLRRQFGKLARFKFFSRLPFKPLNGCYWFKETNGKLFDLVSDERCLDDLLSAPKRNSYAGERAEAGARLVEGVFREIISSRDKEEDGFVKPLQGGVNLFYTRNHRCTDEEFSFFMNYMVLKILWLKINGKIDKDIIFILEESELMGLSPLICKQLISARKFGCSFWVVGQTGTWHSGPDFNITETIFGSCNLIVGRTNSPYLTDRLLKYFSGLLTPQMTKRIRYSYRQFVRGYENVGYESMTSRNSGDSVTTGIRERPIYQGYFEKHVDEYSISEKKEMLRSVFPKFRPGEFLVSVGGEINFMRFPLCEVQKINLHNLVNETYLRPLSVSSTSALKVQTPSKPFNDTAEIWRNLNDSVLLDYLWDDRKPTE